MDEERVKQLIKDEFDRREAAEFENLKKTDDFGYLKSDLEQMFERDGKKYNWNGSMNDEAEKTLVALVRRGYHKDHGRWGAERTMLIARIKML